MDALRLADALEGLFAYDTGCVDSGVKDELLRAEVKAHLRSLGEEEFRLFLSRHVRDRFLSEEALAKRYGIADVKRFVAWMDDDMDCCI